MESLVQEKTPELNVPLTTAAPLRPKVAKVVPASSVLIAPIDLTFPSSVLENEIREKECLPTAVLDGTVVRNCWAPTAVLAALL